MFYLHLDCKIHKIRLNYFNAYSCLSTTSLLSLLAIRLMTNLNFTAEVDLNNLKRIYRYTSWCKNMEQPKYGLEANNRC